MANYQWFRLQSFWLLAALPLSLFALHSQLSATEAVSKPKTVEASAESADASQFVLRKQLPESLEELQVLEDQIQKHKQQMIDSTVAVLVDRTSSQGSGVVINEEGYILTAAHVISRRGIPATIFFSDGSVARAETLGVDQESDAGVLRIVEKGKWKFSKMAEADSTKLGDWCIATGHPGGHRRDRPPVIRIGRVNNLKESMLRTDATLVGGDSGGPLFNLNGEVIGVNSRIGFSTAWNLHVPVGVYHADWENLSSPAGFLGVGGDPRLQNGPCRLTTVRADSPASKAGLKVGDIIKKFEGKRIENFLELVDTVSEYPPETVVKVEVQRGEETLVFEVTLARKDPYSR